ncbi:hypothetical protein KEM48_002133 [Puccinia striiformis f. sp. tritici PST-130]|nr:hypothetical protein KEM48_002133 [Puccinia striiformis f. sp. tritici PST-130]
MSVHTVLHPDEEDEVVQLDLIGETSNKEEGIALKKQHDNLPKTMKIKAKDNKIFIIWRVDDNNLPRFKREVIDRISSLLPEEKIKTCTLVQEDPKIVAQNKLAFRQLRAHLAPNSIPAEPSREPTAGASNSAALHDIIRDLYAAHHPYAWARAIPSFTQPELFQQSASLPPQFYLGQAYTAPFTPAFLGQAFPAQEFPGQAFPGQPYQQVFPGQPYQQQKGYQFPNSQAQGSSNQQTTNPASKPPICRLKIHQMHQQSNLPRLHPIVVHQLMISLRSPNLKYLEQLKDQVSL